MTRTKKDKRSARNGNRNAPLSMFQRRLLIAIEAGNDNTWALRDGQFPQVQSLINQGFIWFGHNECFEITRAGIEKLNEQKQKPA